MKYCEKCGKEIASDSTLCQECDNQNNTAEVNGTKQKKKFNKKLLYIIIPAALVLILVFTGLYIRFWRNIEVEITLDDLTKPSSKISALLKYGTPGVADDDHYFYLNSVTLEGVKLEHFKIFFDEGDDGESYYILMDYNDSADFVSVLREKAELVGSYEYENYVADTTDYIFTFEYEDMEIVLETVHVSKDDASCLIYFICD